MFQSTRDCVLELFQRSGKEAIGVRVPDWSGAIEAQGGIPAVFFNPLGNWLRQNSKHVAPAAGIESWAEFYDASSRSRHEDVKSMLP